MLKRSISMLLVLLFSCTVTARITVRSDLTQIHKVHPGQQVSGTLTIENAGSKEATVRIYQTDYSFQADGTTSYEAPGSEPRSNATWIGFDAARIIIPADTSIDFDYRVSVPEGERVGTFWSMLMIEEVLEREREQGGAIAITTVVRYGIQIVTDFESPGEIAMEFANPVLEQEAAGGYIFQVDSRNVGEKMLQSSYDLELYNSTGSVAARVPGSSRRTYPGTSVRQRFSLGQLAPGSYIAIVIADAGGDALFGARYELRVGGE